VDQSGLRHKEVRIVVPGGNIIFTIFSYVFWPIFSNFDQFSPIVHDFQQFCPIYSNFDRFQQSVFNDFYQFFSNFDQFSVILYDFQQIWPIFSNSVIFSAILTYPVQKGDFYWQLIVLCKNSWAVFSVKNATFFS
jgi:hypothetical protein